MFLVLCSQLFGRAEHDLRRSIALPASGAERQADGRAEHVDGCDVQPGAGVASRLTAEAGRAAGRVVHLDAHSGLLTVCDKGEDHGTREIEHPEYPCHPHQPGRRC